MKFLENQTSPKVMSPIQLKKIPKGGQMVKE
jgi:hypothetical protein